MIPDRKRVRELVAMAFEGEMVPFVSLCLIIAAVLFVGLDYSVLVEGATLMYYAVLVAIWTSIAPTDPLEGGGTYAQFEFLMISTGAVVVGYGIELTIQQLSGQLYAVQALALIVLGSRLYVNSLDGVSIQQTIRWHNPRDRYLFYAPCLVALTLPMALHWLPVGPLLGRPLETPEGLLVVAAASVVLGGALYAVEKWRQFAAAGQKL